MSLEITLRVNGSDSSKNELSYPAENLVTLLRGLEGILNVRYDAVRQRFAVRYDQTRITILRILRQIELAGQAAGHVYRPTDVQASNGDLFPAAG